MPIVPENFWGGPMAGLSAANTGPAYAQSGYTQSGAMGGNISGFGNPYAAKDQWDAYSKQYGPEAANLVFGPQGGQPQGKSTTMWGGTGNVPGGGGATSLATGGAVGAPSGMYNADAQIGQLRDEFRRMRDRSKGGINEDLASRGIFSSGVGSKLMSDQMSALDMQEASGIERLMNDTLGRNQAWWLNQQQQNRSPYGSGEGTRFGNANQNQELMDLFAAMGGGGQAQPQSYSSKSMFGGGSLPQPIGGGGPQLPNMNALMGDMKGMIPDLAGLWNPY